MPKYSTKQLQVMAENVACDCVASHSKRAPKFLRMCLREAKRILSETAIAHDAGPVPCKKHRGYKAVRRPVNGCMDCLKYYNQVQYH